MSDTEKIVALHALDSAATHATKIANGMVRGSEKVANERLVKAMQTIAKDWLGRKLTDAEISL